ncbi:MAG: response regulator, partial [Pseudomonadota bacterium]
MQNAHRVTEWDMISETKTNSLLIVEDDEALRTRLSQAMERRGFAVQAAGSIAEAQSLIDTAAPHFAIVDLRLSDGTGLTVVELLRREQPKCRTVVLTGYGNIPTAVAAARIGAVDYIAK